MRTKTLEEFIKQAKKVHGNKYNYSETVYINNKTKVNIICPIHGKFSQNPRAHLNGSGCAQCQAEKPGVKKYTTETFIEKANLFHNYKYDYSKTVYTGILNNIIVICPIHGEFIQTANIHLNSGGCPKCANLNKGNKKCLDTKSFIQEAVKVHGDRYDYSEVNYVKSNLLVKIKCKIHGIFEQTPNVHLSNHGCPKCGKMDAVYKINMPKEEFIRRAKEIHGDLYDYSEVEFQSNRDKVKIYCKTCKKFFFQAVTSHLKGKGCHVCGIKKQIKNTTKTTEQFIQEATVVHGDKYDYDEVVYKGSEQKVKIFCKKCNRYFMQSPNIHLQGCGCPHCNFSKGEEQIKNWLNSKSINYNFQKRFKGCKYKNLLAFDFYLPDYNICIEYQGIQHYKIVHFKRKQLTQDQLEKEFELRKIRDQIKRDYCKEKGIKLIEVRYNENVKEKLDSEIIL